MWNLCSVSCSCSGSHILFSCTVVRFLWSFVYSTLLSNSLHFCSTDTRSPDNGIVSDLVIMLTHVVSLRRRFSVLPATWWPFFFAFFYSCFLNVFLLTPPVNYLCFGCITWTWYMDVVVALFIKQGGSLFPWVFYFNEYLAQKVDTLRTQKLYTLRTLTNHTILFPWKIIAHF